MRKLSLEFGLFGLLLSASASSLAAERFETEKGPIQVATLATFRSPWGMAFLSPTQLLITERPGSLWLFDVTTGTKRQVDNPPPVYVDGQGGLLDIALHPEFETNALVYFSLSKTGDGGSGTAIVRAQIEGLTDNRPRLTKHETLYEIKPSAGGYHFGSRLAFAPDGTLFATFGDHGERSRAQDVSNASGSVIRIGDDGSIPNGNPRFETKGKQVRAGLWSIGHRNPQGAAIHPQTGALWTVEHGAKGGDEINKPEAGMNYGWPTISYGKHYSGQRIGVGTQAQGMEQPRFYWDPSIAPSGLAFYSGDLFPQWNGNLFVGALKHQKLVRLTLDGEEISGEEILLNRAFGRIRDVRSGPDGALWLLTDSSKGKLLRITPDE